MAGLSQIRYPDTIGQHLLRPQNRGMHEAMSALPALKRKISDTIYAHLLNDPKRKLGQDLGGQTGNGSISSTAGSHPEQPRFRQTTPRSSRTLRPTYRPVAAEIETTFTHCLTPKSCQCRLGTVSLTAPLCP
jgi:hypothetical protein